MRGTKKTLAHIAIGAAVVLAILFFLRGEATPEDLVNTSGEPVRQTEQSSVERMAVLNVPRPDASPEEGQAHFDLVVRLAEPAEHITLSGNCTMDPVVLRLRPSEPLKVRNDSDKNHEIVFDREHVYLVRSGEETTLDFDFPQGPGIYAYACDTNPFPSGFIHVIP